MVLQKLYYETVGTDVLGGPWALNYTIWWNSEPTIIFLDKVRRNNFIGLGPPRTSVPTDS